ncbi:HD domain-containing protein [Halobacillus seohaensis]|uniref:HD domain-containing protein n=1 Tax=Halobacillus seohaensis TaxID=447421 RepID=A0ABW2EFV7_9BACI
MSKDDVLQAISRYVYQQFANDPTGHDFFHMKRVADWSFFLAKEEGANSFVAEAAGWLHDIGDAKLFAQPKQALVDLQVFLRSLDIEAEIIDEISVAIKNVSFSKGAIPETLEGKIVQDADRLDAIGAIGIARTFAYGGVKNQLLHTEDDREATSIQHFYDKLLKLSALIHTDRAKQEAAIRHQFMEEYLGQFLQEWQSNLNSKKAGGQHE